MRTIIAVLLAIGAATSQSSPTTESSPTNLIINGDFESPEAPDRCLNLSGDKLPGWRIESGDVDVVSTYWPAQHGSQSLDLNGFTRGTISQAINTVPGHWYRLIFYYSGNPDEHATGTSRVAEVQWGDKLLTILKPALGSLEDMNWQRQEFTVLAKGSKTALVFSSVTEGAYGVTLDNISLTPCDPPTKE